MLGRVQPTVGRCDSAIVLTATCCGPVSSLTYAILQEEPELGRGSRRRQAKAATPGDGTGRGGRGTRKVATMSPALATRSVRGTGARNPSVGEEEKPTRRKSTPRTSPAAGAMVDGEAAATDPTPSSPTRRGRQPTKLATPVEAPGQLKRSSATAGLDDPEGEGSPKKEKLSGAEEGEVGEHVCSEEGCSKMFRTQTLLDSHVKLYHGGVPPPSEATTPSGSRPVTRHPSTDFGPSPVDLCFPSELLQTHAIACGFGRQCVRY
jgi:hypothetical protein